MSAPTLLVLSIMAPLVLGHLYCRLYGCRPINPVPTLRHMRNNYYSGIMVVKVSSVSGQNYGGECKALLIGHFTIGYRAAHDNDVYHYLKFETNDHSLILKNDFEGNSIDHFIIIFV